MATADQNRLKGQQIPANQKLWNLYVAQAKARYHTWPSPTAAKWVHDHYAQAGGRFVDSEKKVDPRFKDKDKSKEKDQKKKGK